MKKPLLLDRGNYSFDFETIIQYSFCFHAETTGDPVTKQVFTVIPLGKPCGDQCLQQCPSTRTRVHVSTPIPRHSMAAASVNHFNTVRYFFKTSFCTVSALAIGCAASLGECLAWKMVFSFIGSFLSKWSETYIVQNSKKKTGIRTGARREAIYSESALKTVQANVWFTYLGPILPEPKVIFEFQPPFFPDVSSARVCFIRNTWRYCSISY